MASSIAKGNKIITLRDQYDCVFGTSALMEKCRSAVMWLWPKDQNGDRHTQRRPQ